MELDKFVASAKNSNLGIDRYCKIKTYLTVQEKIDFIKEYYGILTDMFKDDKYRGAENLVAFVIFNLMAVKKYTDIELNISFESMDLLHKNGLMDKIVAKIGNDYDDLLNFIKE